ncbi:hypothetical protein EZS27_030384 [termite gut metagenome]|uniref:Uncharacterized protein n=1 Tax=termite gut metagenome TaxID=433724 RepID=A0A5J4QDM0_9ZZZZ
MYQFGEMISSIRYEDHLRCNSFNKGSTLPMRAAIISSDAIITNLR